MQAIESWLAQAEAHRRETGKPLVSLCYAQSLDGSITARRGEPTALSGQESSRLTHQLRAAHDAILVGVGTVLADNPRLTVRLAQGRQPQPVILDSHCRTSLDARLLREHPLPAWIATTQAAPSERRLALESARGRLLVLPAGSQGRVDLPALLDCLAEMGVNSLMVEGGANVITSFLSQHLADQVVLTIAPVFLGGLHTFDGARANSLDVAQDVISRTGVQANSLDVAQDVILRTAGQANSLSYKGIRLNNVRYEILGEDLIVFGQL